MLEVILDTETTGLSVNENHRIDVANWILNILKEMDEQNASFACFSEAYFCPKNKKSYQGFLKTGKILHLRHFIAHRQTFLKLRAFQESLLQDYYGFMLSSKIMQARQNCVFSKISLCSSIKQILKPHDWDQYWYLMVQHNLFNRIQERPKFLANNKQFSYLMDADGGIFMISEKEKTVSQRESSIAQVSNSRL